MGWVPVCMMYTVKNTTSHKTRRICRQGVLVVKKKNVNLCGSDIEEREDGVGTGVNSTVFSETLVVINLTESAGREFRL